MVKKRILVTGGNGYIGARLCLYLADAGHEVTPLCYPQAPDSEAWCAKMKHVVVGDIRDEAFLADLAQKYTFDALIHLVSLDHHQSAGAPAVVSAVNITPTWSLLDVFSKAGLKQFLYFSTMQVYGALKGAEVVEETRMPAPANAYALTHLLGEEFCAYYNQNSAVQCRVVRLSNSYGAPMFMENNCWWLVVNDLCRMACRDHRLVLQSDGTPQRDFIHGWDVCRAVECILSAEHGGDMIYNVSTGVTLTMLEIAQTIQQVYLQRYGVLLPLEVGGGSGSSARVMERYTISNQRLRNLGFSPQWTLQQGIGDLFDYLEAHSTHE